MKKRKKGRLSTFFLLLFLFLVGLGIYLYPYIADAWNAYRNSLLIAEYKAVAVSDESVNQYDEILKKADEYNRHLAQTSKQVVTELETKTDAEYESLLNYLDSGVMGYIEIPKIQISVPVHHYSSDEILEKGIGHIHGSSLPVGGIGTHSVLTGHRGLSESKLFTDLDKVEIGDKFYLHMLTRDLAYEVTNISVVWPYEVESLTINPEEDLVTLVTCTPYGVNTHRLLVTGKRTEYDIEEIERANQEGRALQTKSVITPLNGMIAGFIVFTLIIVIFVFSNRRKNKKK